ncbi:protein kinase [Actinomadura sp. WMMB 499]|uniref:protein kinase domain-containing protein n=1 Tax=Actinomadura sp. WMMB 499 TaxID=1219491 RepID=UPI0012449DFC|nr:protein kinase [Actinomadura sp. WMMB 499]QFG22303.1 protein kinase [Actinomadura sp. WMMB 499]
MAASVRLTVVAGGPGEPSGPSEYVFGERTTRVLGRASDCDPRLGGDGLVSRHHCLLDVNPPQARIRDFGSLNGTRVNGVKIGQRDRDQTPEEGARLDFPEHDLADGDEIEIGGYTLRVGVRGEPTRVLNRCVRCGADVPAGAGDRVCPDCRAEPSAMLELLLELAGSGDREPASIAGLTLLRELGRGGMGVVHLARDATGAEVALKLMLPRAAADDTARRRFLTEVELTRSLRHRHITELYDAGFADGAFYFTLEYCPGGGVDRRGKMPAREAVPIVLQVLDALEYAHGRGVVHRDLSPSNILLSGGDAKVCDFGLAKAFDAHGLSGLTRTGTTAGKPYFVPRRQVVNFKEASPELDVWAAAASLYAMLTGRPPRRFPAGADPWLHILQTDPVPIREREPALPPGLAEVVDHALTERPRIGFPTARELRRALEPHAG